MLCSNCSPESFEQGGKSASFLIGFLALSQIPLLMLWKRLSERFKTINNCIAPTRVNDGDRIRKVVAGSSDESLPVLPSVSVRGEYLYNAWVVR